MNDFFEKEIYLHNDIVSLVPFSLNYMDSLKNIIFDESIWTYMGMSIKTEDDLWDYVTSTMNDKQRKLSYPFIIIDNRTKEVAGSTRYGNLNFDNKRLEIGWTWYGEKFQGTGLNKACKFELIKYAFETMDFNRVQFSADFENIKSQKAILKLGAKQEGVFRSNYVDQYGNCRDDVYFSLISSEWNKVSADFFQEYQTALED